MTPERFRTSLDKALEHWHQRDTAARTTFTGGVVLYFCIAPTYEAARANAVHTLSTEYNQSFETIIDKYSALGPASEVRGHDSTLYRSRGTAYDAATGGPCRRDPGPTPTPGHGRIAALEAKRSVVQSKSRLCVAARHSCGSRNPGPQPPPSTGCRITSGMTGAPCTARA